MCIQRLCRQFISSPSSHWLQTLQILKRSTALASQSLVRPEHLSGDEYSLLHVCMSVAVADSWQTHGVCTVDVVFSASNCWVRSNFFLSKIIRPIYNVVFDEWQLICHHDIHHRPIHLIRYGNVRYHASDQDWASYSPCRIILLCHASVPHAVARYQYVDIDQNNQKDKKKLKPGLENFLPPDAAGNAFKGVVSRKRA